MYGRYHLLWTVLLLGAALVFCAGPLMAQGVLTVEIVDPATDPYSVKMPTAVRFEAVACLDGEELENGQVTWHWDFGDTYGESSANPTSYVFLGPGTYIVTVTATYGGQQAQDQVTVIVTPETHTDGIELLKTSPGPRVTWPVLARRVSDGYRRWATKLWDDTYVFPPDDLPPGTYELFSEGELRGSNWCWSHRPVTLVERPGPPGYIERCLQAKYVTWCYLETLDCTTVPDGVLVIATGGSIAGCRATADGGACALTGVKHQHALVDYGRGEEIYEFGPLITAQKAGYRSITAAEWWGSGDGWEWQFPPLVLHFELTEAGEPSVGRIVGEIANYDEQDVFPVCVYPNNGDGIEFWADQTTEYSLLAGVGTREVGATAGPFDLSQDDTYVHGLYVEPFQYVPVNVSAMADTRQDFSIDGCYGIVWGQVTVGGQPPEYATVYFWVGVEEGYEIGCTCSVDEEGFYVARLYPATYHRSTLGIWNPNTPPLSDVVITGGTTHRVDFEMP